MCIDIANIIFIKKTEINRKLEENRMGSILPEIEIIIEDCQKKLWDSKLVVPEKSVYKIDNFVVNSPLMYPGHDIWSFTFLKIGSGAKVKFIEFEKHHSLSIFNPQGSIEIRSGSSLYIRELVKINPGQTGLYPHVEFTWVGENKNGLNKGELEAVRVRLGENEYVTYSHLNVIAYDTHNSQNVGLDKHGLPKNIKDVSKILGVPFDMRIDFDVRSRRIFEDSGLKELADKIDQLDK